MSQNSPHLLTSTLLLRARFRHAFFTRRGGVSAPPFDSLNFSFAVGDDPAAVQANLARGAKELGVAPERLYYLSQVHGRTVVVIDGTEPVDHVRNTEGDALVSGPGAHACGVRVADCVPILLADPASRVVAAVHAGWRGVAAGVVGATLERMEQQGGDVGRVIAAIGPHISVDAFEVGDDVADQLASVAGTDEVVHRVPGARPHVDLRQIVLRQLLGRDVAPERVDFVEGCTVSDAQRFFSFRRDGKRGGRHLAAIVG